MGLIFRAVSRLLEVSSCLASQMLAGAGRRCVPNRLWLRLCSASLRAPHERNGGPFANYAYTTLLVRSVELMEDTVCCCDFIIPRYHPLHGLPAWYCR